MKRIQKVGGVIYPALRSAGKSLTGTVWPVVRQKSPPVFKKLREWSLIIALFLLNKSVQLLDIENMSIRKASYIICGLLFITGYISSSEDGVFLAFIGVMIAIVGTRIDPKEKLKG